METLIIAVVGSLLSMMAPGPNLAAVASTALGSGRIEAMAVAGGVSVGTMIWVLFAAFGFGALLSVQPALLALMKILGGAYLIWIALRVLIGLAKSTPAPVNCRKAQGSVWRSFAFGIAVVGTNPKALLLWASISTLLFSAGHSAWTVALFAPAAGALSFINYSAYAWLFSSRTVQRTVGLSSKWLDAVFAGCFGWFGGKLIMDGLREVRT